MSNSLLKEAIKRLSKAKFEVFRLQDIADELVRSKSDASNEIELRHRLQEARERLEAADRQLMDLGAYRTEGA